MANLVEAMQNKFNAMNADEIAAECKIKRASRAGGVRLISTHVIAMDNQNIVTVGDIEPLRWVFDNLQELDLSSNKIKSWSEVFTVLESSPRLQILNLSYNPLHAAALFCEPAYTVLDSQSYDQGSCSSSPATDPILCYHQDVSLLNELSFNEENAAREAETAPMDVGEIGLADFLMSSSPSDQFISPQLTTLVLNSTYVPWQRILTLLSYLPGLHTLHAALNDFDRCCCEEDSISNGPSTFPQLTHLFFSDNRLANWSAVCCLGRHFPALQYLVLLGNPLTSVTKPDPSDASTAKCFDNVTSLNLTETEIDSWDSVDALNYCMPALLSLKLGNALPLFKDSDADMVRNEVIARMPDLTSYNNTLISAEERERAERDFVRRFGQLNSDQRPNRYWELENQHGKVEPLAVIDLSPKRFVRLCVRLGDQEKWHNFCLRKSTQKVKQEICHLFGLDEKNSKHARLYYLDQAMVGALGPEELKTPSRLLYTYHPEDGDVLEIFFPPSVSSKPSSKRVTAHAVAESSSATATTTPATPDAATPT
ncbi:hypothetical protein AAHC03_024405 [Spirometra sp. Aus1]